MVRSWFALTLTAILSEVAFVHSQCAGKMDATLITCLFH
jgi:hypothetical protein